MANATALSTMLELQRDSQHIWNASEFGAILRHEMEAPLRLALGTFSAQIAHELSKGASREEEIQSLQELFCQEAPPIALLHLVKRFGKQCSAHPESPLPREIGMLLYYASIGVARLKLGQQVSNLPDVALVRGLGWASTRDWADASLRAMLKEAEAHVKQNPWPGTKGPQGDGEGPTLME